MVPPRLEPSARSSGSAHATQLEIPFCSEREQPTRLDRLTETRAFRGWFLHTEPRRCGYQPVRTTVVRQCSVCEYRAYRMAAGDMKASGYAVACDWAAGEELCTCAECTVTLTSASQDRWRRGGRSCQMPHRLHEPRQQVTAAVAVAGSAFPYAGGASLIKPE